MVSYLESGLHSGLANYEVRYLESWNYVVRYLESWLPSGLANYGVSFIWT